ncbi:MAG: hypothetical protein IJI73_09670 [Kiritimatiellae bacterium]|nr:hypothetical protein [Kiritimatiellia bacterium]
MTAWILALTAVFCAFSAGADPGRPERTTGYVPPARATVATRAASAARRTALRSESADTPPARWDSREQGWITPVRNQGSVGACWAFASYATLEAQMLKSGRGETDFSEKNMVNLSGRDYGPNDGGNYDMAAGYLLRWAGAVAETNDAYRGSLNTWTASKPFNPPVHVQNAVWVPPVDGSEESIAELKRAVIRYGAVAVSLYWGGGYESSNRYYCCYSKNDNHAVTIVGWDDGCPADSFWTPPPGNGAWLIKNSWGTSTGDGGYFFVSYHDKQLARGGGTVFVPACEGEDYSAVYGHDREGPLYDVTRTFPDNPACSIDLQGAVFTSAWNEELAAVGVYSAVCPNSYEISVYTNVVRGGASPSEGGALALRTTGELTHAGFTTIPLHCPVPLADGTVFSIVYRQTGTDRSTLVNCASVNYDGGTTNYTCRPSHSPGDSYFGRIADGGETWRDGTDTNLVFAVDASDESWGACIKAYTRTTMQTREGDRPGETENGAEFLESLESGNPALFADAGGTFGAVANLVGANGRTMWTSWLAGLDPANPLDDEFTVSISVADGTPSLSWTPDLGDRRVYTIEGRETLSPESAWFAVDRRDLGATAARVFRVNVRTSR